MAARIVLARLPGAPFHIDDIRPDSDLLVTSAAAESLGHAATLHDLGTLDVFEMLYPAEMRADGLHWAASLTTGQLLASALSRAAEKLPKIPAGLAKAQRAAYELLGEQLVARTRPDAVILKINGAKDLAPACRAAARVRAYRPYAKVFAYGDVLRTNDSAFSKALKHFDAIGLDKYGSGLLELAGIAHARDWRGVSGVAFHDGVRLNVTRQARDGAEPLPVLTPLENSLYMFPSPYSRIRVLDLLAVGAGSGSSSMGPNGTAQDRAGNEALAFIRTFAERFGGSAFYFCLDSDASDATSTVDFARLLLSSDTRFQYACSVNAPHTQKTQLGLLAASGCVAVDVPLRSGSQRLLDEYYQNGVSVTHAERLVRAARFAGLFTATHFTYPCAEDDYHTEDETLRLIRRARPSSAVVTAEPGNGGRGGFALTEEFAPFARRARSRANKRTAELCTKIREEGTPVNLDARVALLAGLAGYRNREQEFAETVGLQLLSGDATGLAETIERINAGAARPARTVSFKPLALDQNAAAN